MSQGPDKQENSLVIICLHSAHSLFSSAQYSSAASVAHNQYSQAALFHMEPIHIICTYVTALSRRLDGAPPKQLARPELQLRGGGF